MLGNLLRPWLLARFVTSTTAAVLAVVVVVMAIRLLSAPALLRAAEGGSAEGRLVLDRRAELLASITRVMSALAIGSLVLSVLGADRLHGTMRGAMCAYGVLAATPYGFRSLVVAIVAALVASAWLSLHRAESSLAEPLLTRAKLSLAALMAPLLVADLVLGTLHALSLDFREVASCCSSGVTTARAVLGASGGPRTWFVAAFFIFGALAALGAMISARRPSSLATRATAVFSLVAAGVAPLAIATWVAPHAYGTPNHLCPFCLLRADEALGLGYPLYAALFVAVSRGMAVGMTAWVDRRRGASGPGADSLAPILHRNSVGAAVAWCVALVLAAGPWALFTWASGGAHLFG